MKTKHLIPIVILTLFAFTSCTETYVERVSADYWQIVDIDIPASSWCAYSSDGMEAYYQADVNIPELTKTVFDDGFVLCYLVEDGVQMQLPYTRHYENLEGDRWTATLDYDYFVGGMRVYYTTNDFYYTADQPGYMRLRLVMQW